MKHSYLAFTLSACCLTAALGWVVGLNRGLDIGETRTKAAYKTGYERGRSSATLKDIIDVDHDAVRRVCTLWWFGMNGEERNLSK